VTGYAEGLKFLLSQLGISDRTVRYRTSVDDVLFEKRA
jgi:hypothetical protein